MCAPREVGESCQASEEGAYHNLAKNVAANEKSGRNKSSKWYPSHRNCRRSPSRSWESLLKVRRLAPRLSIFTEHLYQDVVSQCDVLQSAARHRGVAERHALPHEGHCGAALEARRLSLVTTEEHTLTYFKCGRC